MLSSRTKMKRGLIISIAHRQTDGQTHPHTCHGTRGRMSQTRRTNQCIAPAACLPACLPACRRGDETAKTYTQIQCRATFGVAQGKLIPWPHLLMSSKYPFSREAVTCLRLDSPYHHSFISVRGLFLCLALARCSFVDGMTRPIQT